MFSFLLTSCGSENSSITYKNSDRNNLELRDYSSGLFSAAELTRVNAFAELDDNESFSFIVDNTGFVIGNKEKMNKVLNWGSISDFAPSQCEYENFWTSSTSELASSLKVKGLVVNFSAINSTVENFDKSKVLVLGQYMLILNSESVATELFENISDSLLLCSDGVRALNSDGSIADIGLRNAPYKNRRYFKGDNLVIRSAQDVFVGLDIYYKTRYSIVFYKVFLNDLLMPKKSTWGQINDLIQTPLDRVCVIEDCQVEPIDLSGVFEYTPSGVSDSDFRF